MKRPRAKLVRGERFTDRIFKPYVTAIGELALAWNDLHEKLGWLFYLYIDTGDEQGSRLWNAPQFRSAKARFTWSDRASYAAPNVARLSSTERGRTLASQRD